jgi:hypothetical protein
MVKTEWLVSGVVSLPLPFSPPLIGEKYINLFLGFLDIQITDED